MVVLLVTRSSFLAMCVFANIDMSVAVKCLRIYIQHFCARKGDEHKIPLTVFGAKCCCRMFEVTVLEWFNSKCERVCDIVAGL